MWPVAGSRPSRRFAVVLCLVVLWAQAALPGLQAQSQPHGEQVDLVAFLSTYEGTSPAAQDQVRIVVIQGDGATNNIVLGTAEEPIVAVLGPINNPLQGASVTFTLPESGAGGLFPDGSTTLTVVTDEDGRAVAEGLVPNQLTGEFPIQITASVQNLLLGLTQTSSLTITQTNARAVTSAGETADGAGGGGSGRLIGILLGVAGAVGVGLAVSGGGSNTGTPPPSTPTTTISPGGVATVGAPQ